MNVNEQTFNQLMELDGSDMAELINTVGLAAVHKSDIKEAKLIFASLLVQHGIQILESQDCRVLMSIDNEGWENAIEYGETRTSL